MHTIILKTRIVKRSDQLLEKHPLHDKLFTGSAILFGVFFLAYLFAGGLFGWLYQVLGFVAIGMLISAYILRFSSREMKNAQFTGTIQFTEEGIIANDDPIIPFSDMRNIRVHISGYKNKFKWQLLEYQGLLDAGIDNTLRFEWNGNSYRVQFYFSRRKNAVLVHNLFVRLSRKKQIQFYSFLNYSDWLPR